MADILKISTPLVDRNNALHQNKPTTTSDAPFQISEMSKVIKTNSQSELLQQNNGMPTRDESPAILMNLLRDPSVSMNFLKNIYLLQEIINLIPVNNEALTSEINQLFNSLMVQPQAIAGELQSQEADATMFRGELFDMLRGLVNADGGRPEMRYAVANLLKSLNAIVAKEGVLSSVSNNLSFLAGQLQSSKGVYGRLLELAERFSIPSAPREFGDLKAQTMLLLREVEGSILFNPKLEKTLPLITYNLSRYNDNPDYLQEAANSLMNLMATQEQKEKLVQGLKKFLMSEPLRRAGVPDESGKPGSKVMDALARLIGKEASSPELSLANSDKLEKIIQSLLSSPCNFTPLLHFIVPVDDGGAHSFAEIWIDTSEEGNPTAKGDKDGGMHMLIVFDIERVGQFEAELTVSGKKLSLNLLCPPAYTERFAGLRNYAAKIAAGTNYSLNEIYIGSLERPRSLMDVFKTLPHRRAGIDVKV